MNPSEGSNNSFWSSEASVHNALWRSAGDFFEKDWTEYIDHPSQGDHIQEIRNGILGPINQDLLEKDRNERIGRPNQGSPMQEHLKEVLGLINQDGRSVPSTSITNPVGIEKIEHLIGENQATLDEAESSIKSLEETTQSDKMEKKVTQQSTSSFATSPRNKREKPLLDDEEKKKRKKIAEDKYRSKRKENNNRLQEELQVAKRKIEELESENRSMNQKLENSTTQASLKKAKEKLQAAKRKMESLENENKLLTREIIRKSKNEDMMAQKLLNSTTQDEVGKTEELRRLKTEICELQRKNEFLIVDRETMKKDVQTVATNFLDQLQSQISTFKGMFTQQQPLDFYSNGLISTEMNSKFRSATNIVSMEQEQLRQKENGRLALNATITQQQHPQHHHLRLVAKGGESDSGKILMQQEVEARSWIPESMEPAKTVEGECPTA